jgi:hypothetical protein
MRLSFERPSRKPWAFPYPGPCRWGGKGESHRFLRSRRSMCIAAAGSAGTWEILSSPRSKGGVTGGRPPKAPRPCDSASAVAREQTPDAAVVPSIAKENEAEAGSRAGSLSVRVVPKGRSSLPVKQGERAIDRHPAEGRRTPEHGIVLGNYDGCIEIRVSYPRDRNG